jgi:hypothetical protein
LFGGKKREAVERVLTTKRGRDDFHIVREQVVWGKKKRDGVKPVLT